MNDLADADESANFDKVLAIVRATLRACPTPLRKALSLQRSVTAPHSAY